MTALVLAGRHGARSQRSSDDRRRQAGRTESRKSSKIKSRDVVQNRYKTGLGEDTLRIAMK